jgi:NitT/TauT family transport system substrate-binding protein
MKHWKRRTGLVGALCLGLVLMVVLLAACGGTTTTTAANATTTSVAAAPVKLTVVEGSSAVYPFYEPYVAKSQGFFEKRGLDVTIIEVDGAEATTTAFASGQADIEMSDLSTLNPQAISAMGENHPIMFFAFMTTPFSIYVPADSPIQDPKELDGKVVAVNSEQDPGMSLIKTVNLEYGINAGYLIVNEAPQAMAALDRGDVVAYASSSTGAARIEAAGVEMRSIIPQEMIDKSGVFGYWASQATMDKNPDAFKAFVAALQEARAYIADDPQKLYDWANAQNPIPEEEQAFRKALAKVVISIRTHENPLGSINPDKWQVWWDALVANGTINSSIGQPTDFYTNKFFQ